MLNKIGPELIDFLVFSVVPSSSLADWEYINPNKFIKIDYIRCPNVHLQLIQCKIVNRILKCIINHQSSSSYHSVIDLIYDIIIYVWHTYIIISLLVGILRPKRKFRLISWNIHFLKFSILNHFVLEYFIISYLPTFYILHIHNEYNLKRNSYSQWFFFSFFLSPFTDEIIDSISGSQKYFMVGLSKWSDFIVLYFLEKQIFTYSHSTKPTMKYPWVLDIVSNISD